MRKVVYNECFGGFSLSKQAIIRAREISGNNRWGDCLIPGELYEDGTPVSDTLFGGFHPDIERHNPVLVQVVEELGQAANSRFSDLRIAEVQGRYRIDEYDGSETVIEPEDDKYID